MFIDTRRYERGSLPEEKRDFLVRLVSFARLIQATTYDKCEILRIDSVMGICSSIVMGDIIIKSNWGTHLAASKESNLSLLEKTEYWKGKCIEIEGKGFRCYPSWLDFSLDWTDELTFYERGKYEDLLGAKNPDAQMDIMSNLQDDPTIYRGRILELIGRYGLWEFDW